MDAKRFGESSLPVAKKVRFDEPNASNEGGNSSNQNTTQMEQVKETQSTQPTERNEKIQNKSSYGDESERAEGIDDLDSSQSLMILVDDCLLTILEYLKPEDLINVAHANKRLNRLVKFFVQIKIKVEFVPNGNWIQRDLINVEALQVLLGICGKEIQSLTLNRKSFDNTFNDDIDMDRIRYFMLACCRLTELTLIGFKIWFLIQNFGSQLKSLTLDNCSVDQTSRAWNNMKQLTTLKLSKVLLSNHRVIELIKSSQNLKSLSIVNCRELSAFICNAVGSLKHLEEFEFKRKKGGNNDFLPLASLKKLKVLKLAHPGICGGAGAQQLFDKFVANGITLEHLELGLTPLNSSLTESISKIQSIKILKLSEMAGLNESSVMRFASQLKLLEELHVKTKANITQRGIKNIVRAANHLTCFKVDAPGFVINVRTYKSLLVTVKARETQSKLQLTIYGNGNQVTVPSGIMSGSNEKWLALEELDRNEHHLFEVLTAKV